MFEMEKGSKSKWRKDAIYNPIEGKWERKLTGKYRGELDDFSFEDSIQSTLTDVKDKAISAKEKTKDFAKSESVKLHINELKTTMKESIQKLKEISEEKDSNEQNGTEVYEQNHIKEVNQDDAEVYEDPADDVSNDAEEEGGLGWLKFILAIIGLIIAFVSD